MDAIDEKKTFKDKPENANTFTRFIQLAFNFFIQECLLDKDVNDAVKNLNYITVDIEIFAADGKIILQQLDIRSFLNLDQQYKIIQQNMIFNVMQKYKQNSDTNSNSIGYGDTKAIVLVMIIQIVIVYNII